ncbi:MAG TPA: Ig-like domain-containing domain [Daejeonella sp.]|nr:Ig-like domain-containing domain [Daejeonella sp.]
MAKFSKCKIELIFLSLLLVLYGCASIQSPTGGPRDKQPPKVVEATPKNMTTRFKAQNIKIKFDEFIKLNSEFTEISISPAMDKMPSFKARKEILDIKFDQPLDSATTYTINFGKAIGDVNENNILKNYSYVFSTGDLIDSLSISGTVKGSLKKDSLLDATVFILPVKQDSIFGKKRANIFTSTDSAGNFILKNLREDSYLLYALKEEAPDRIYNSPAELIGFFQDTIHLNKNVADLELNVFQQIPETFSIKERKIENDGRILLLFNKPLPDATVNIIAPTALSKVKKEFELTASKDSAYLWIQDLTFDSLKVSIAAKAKPLDTVQVTRNKRDTYNRAVTISDNLASGKLKPGGEVVLTMSSPVASYDLTKFALLEDSVSVTGLQILKDSLSTRKYKVKFPWRSNREYTIKASADAFTDIFNNKSKDFTSTLTLDTEENYGTIALAVSVPETGKTYLIQWLNNEDKLLRTDKVTKDTTINYIRYPTAKYKVRVVYDLNNNEVWDTGSVKQRRQPEPIWNLNKLLTLRPNWDLEEKVVIPKNP